MTNNKKYLIPHSTEVDKSYADLLKELKSILAKAQDKAYKTVDNIRVQAYWQIGERIVREELNHKNRADYGKYLIDNLAIDLGFGKRLIYRIVKFYRLYEIVSAVQTQLSWYHYVELINIDDDRKRVFYQNKGITNSWGYRELHKQIKSSLYENTPEKEVEDTFKIKLPAIEPQAIFKGVYDFDFIEPPHSKNEKDLENKIIDNFEHFLKEMGENFSILGRQTPIKIDGQAHYIDLVLYNRGIPCIVLVDLKIGKLDSRDIGQMNKYIGFYRRNRQYEHEKDTIGLIICQDAGREEVVYALDGLEKKIFVAKYKVELPSEENIKKAIKGSK